MNLRLREAHIKSDYPKAWPLAFINFRNHLEWAEYVQEIDFLARLIMDPNIQQTFKINVKLYAPK